MQFRQLRLVVTVALLTIGYTTGAQVSALGARSRNPDAGAAPQNALIRIVTPVPNQRLTEDSTIVRFEVVKPAVFAGAPDFLVQLDGNAPITTSRTSQPFKKLAPGAHTVSVQLVANRTPVVGGRAAVQFFVSPQESSKLRRQLKLAGLTFTKPDPKGADSDLPPASSPLPLISIIGFGILVGGIVSAMKTRS